MINSESPIPIYMQIVSVLKREILQLKYGDNGSIGTHSELAERFGVSMITIRKAIAILAEDNMIITKQGKGTFVKSPVFQDDLHELTAVSSIISRQNVEAKVVIKSMGFITTPDDFGEKIRSLLGKECLYVERLHIIDSAVFGYARIYLPYNYGKDLTRTDLKKHSVYELYENKFGLDLGKGIQYVSADKADADLAEVLDVSLNTPVLKIEREAYSSTGTLIEVMNLFYAYHRYSLKIELNLTSK